MFTLFMLQDMVYDWMKKCFDPVVVADGAERDQRFLEEALELVQSRNMSRQAAHQLVDYVYGRAAGEPEQEVAGVLISLAALTANAEIDMEHAVMKELERINDPEMIVMIKAKQAVKPRF